MEPAPCTIEGMSNCAQVGDVVIGSQPSQATLEYLASQGYTTVVSTRGAGEIEWDERAAVEALGMLYISIPMESPVTGITDDQVAALDEVMGGEGPMLLHCGSGNRVAGLWGAWLAERQEVGSAEALRLAELAGMTRVRPVLEERLGSGGQ
jgi:uncharacterized protein (TIGR01244 family)